MAKVEGISVTECSEYINAAIFRVNSPDYGEKYPRWPGSVGIEVEMLPVYDNGNALPGLVRLQGEKSTAKILTVLADEKKWRVEYTEGDHDKLVARIFPDPIDNITFEPGGQVEIASKPYPCLSDAIKRVRSLQSILTQHFADNGISLNHVGINPWYTVDEIGLQMPKHRYRAMHQYYSSLSEYGPRMMRQTCTIQVNLDFGSDEATLAKRYLASNLLAPFNSAIFTNSPVVDNKFSGIKGFRRKVWKYTDPTHTGVPGVVELAENPTREVCLRTYVDYVMQANVVYVEALNYKVLAKPVSFQYWIENGIEGVYPTLADFKTHLSLMFTEVRPRGFLEIRSIDCQPHQFQPIPARYLCGLLYDDATLDKVLELLVPYAKEILSFLEASEQGLDDPKILEISNKVFQLAIQGFANLPSCFKEEQGEFELERFYDFFTARGLTPADYLLETMKQRDEKSLTLAGLRATEERWSGIYL